MLLLNSVIGEMLEMLFVFKIVLIHTVNSLELLLIQLLLNLKQAIKHFQLLVESIVLILWRLRVNYWLIWSSQILRKCVIALVFHRMKIFLELIILYRVASYHGRCHLMRLLTHEIFLELLGINMALELPESLQVLGMEKLLLVVEIIKKLVSMSLPSDVLFKVDVIDIVLLRNYCRHRLQSAQLLLESLA